MKTRVQTTKRRKTNQVGSGKVRRVAYPKGGPGARLTVAEPKASPVAPSKSRSKRKRRYARLRRLLRQWMDEDPVYDERVSAALEALDPTAVKQELSARNR